MLSIQAGEAVRLRFRAATPAGQVIRPPAAVTLTVSRNGVAGDPVHALAEWDGREWIAVMDTADWPPGSYTVTAEVSGPDGRGIAQAEVDVTAP
jgi:hypothetical protein